MARYNLKSPAVKRLMKEAEELREASEEYFAQPLEDNLFEWHFTLRGPPTTEFDGGVYHGRITLPTEYPMKPPSIIILTPNGRFEVNKKICLSISGHHPETWQPSWSIRTALLAMIGFFPTHGNGAIGSLDYTPEERKTLAVKSQNWKCSECGYIKDFLKKNVDLSEKSKVLEEKLQEECEVTQLAALCTSRLLAEADFKQENIRLSKLGQIQLDGLENSIAIPQSSTSNITSDPTVSLPRNRHLTPNQEVPNMESINLNEIKAVQSDKIKSAVIEETNCVYNYFSLLVIWLIVIILSILVARRILYT